MTSRTYHVPPGGHPAQTELLTGRAVFTDAYAVIPKGVIRDIVTSYLPHWDKTRVWVLARPLSGFAETFSHYLIDVAPGGGSESPEPDAGAEGALFVVGGELTLKLAGTEHVLRPGGFAYLPPGSSWSVQNRGSGSVHFHWIRKLYQRVPGIAVPDAIVTNEKRHCADADAGYGWQVGDDAFRRSVRYPARHAHDDRDVRTWCVDPVRRDPCDGTRPLCAGRQGRLPAQSGLG